MSAPHAKRRKSLGASVTARIAHAFALICGALFLVSLRWYVLYRYQPVPKSLPQPLQLVSGCSVAISIGGGAVRIMRWLRPDVAYAQPSPTLVGWFGGRYDQPLVWWLQSSDSPHQYRAYPLWILALAAYTPRLAFACRDSLRTLRRRCHACGYSLAGLCAASDGLIICPECGATARST